MGIGPAQSSSNGASNGRHGGPVSIEELLAKQKSSKEEAAKVFLSFGLLWGPEVPCTCQTRADWAFNRLVCLAEVHE